MKDYVNHLVDAQSAAASTIVIIMPELEEGLAITLSNLFILQMQKVRPRKRSDCFLGFNGGRADITSTYY